MTSAKYTAVHGDEMMRDLDEVQQLVIERCRPLGKIEVPLAEAHGYILAEDVVVEGEVPPFANTAMDGYAVVAADTESVPVELEIVGVLAAGQAPGKRPLERGQAIQIMTGAPMPPGADAVVMVERTAAGSGTGRVRIEQTVTAGANVRPAGSDYEAGAVALVAGVELGPAQLGILATAGRSQVVVFARPKVGVMSTGDELVGGDAPLQPGQIRDSNRLTLLACLRRDGFEATDLGVVRDTREDVERALSEALRTCDAVLSSGGVSKGEFDYVKGVLDALATSGGGEAFELSVRIKPAKPLALAWLPRHDDREAASTPVVFFGLPGNPVSSLVSYEVVALPGLRSLAGWPTPVPPPVRAVALEALPGSRDGRLHLVRVETSVSATGQIGVRSAGGQQSHQLSGTASANALACIPEAAGIDEGDVVEIILFKGSVLGAGG